MCWFVMENINNVKRSKESKIVDKIGFVEKEATRETLDLNGKVFYAGKEFDYVIGLSNIQTFSDSIANFVKSTEGDYLVDMDGVSVADSSWAAALITQMREDSRDKKKKMYICNLNEGSSRMMGISPIGRPLKQRLLGNDSYDTTSKYCVGFL